MRDLDPHRLHVLVQVAHVILMIGAKAGLLEAHRERERAAALDELVRRFDSAQQAKRTAPNP